MNFKSHIIDKLKTTLYICNYKKSLSINLNFKKIIKLYLTVKLLESNLKRDEFESLSKRQN
jgi:hypothetical protein